MDVTDRSDLLARASADYEAHRWTDAVAGFEAAGGFVGLEPRHAERLAWSVVWTGPSAGTCMDAFERLEVAYRGVGDRRGAARAALELARMNSLVGNELVSAACWTRAVESLGDDHESAEYAMAWVLAGFARLMEGDLEGMHDLAGVALRLGLRIGDVTVEAMASYLVGQATVLVGAVEEGLALLDRSMSVATTGGVQVMYAGLIYCGVLWACRQIADWGRAAEWHSVGARWCRREAVVHFPAHLSLHRSELARVQGRLDEAERAAEDGLDEAGDWGRDVTAWAHHQLGETRLCLGDLSGADAAFERADQLGYAPEPGRSRLLLLLGRPEAALRSITRAIDTSNFYGLNGLLHTLPIGVSIAVALARLDTAAQWCGRLDKLAERYRTPGSIAAARVARGELALARGAGAEAIESLRVGIEHWRQAEGLYDSARAQVLLGRAYGAHGEREAERVELESARSAFDRLGASEDTQRVDSLLSRASRSGSGGRRMPDEEAGVGLTPRQCQVAALVAQGLTNQQIAEQLVVSRFTAETHVKNVLTRLGFSSRAEIAAWAATHGLTGGV